VIAVDAIYSTDGSVSPLAGFVQLAEETGCVLVVDESHALGTHGPAGAGMACGLGLAQGIHFRTVSLAKSFAGRAGFVTCSTEFKGFFKVKSRAAIFSSGLLAHECAWLEAALAFVAVADDRRERLHRVARRARAELARLGYNVSDGTEQIIALEAGTEPQTMRLRDALQRRGIFGAVFCHPATPKNRSLVRLTFNASHTDADVDRLVAACADMRGEVEVVNWSSTRRAAKAEPGAAPDPAS
jgi:CAI-1 autoinducer synthase